jgi:hypothetical protein
MAAPKDTPLTLTLTEPEAKELLRILERDLTDLQVEKRRTEAPEYRAELSSEVTVLRSLTQKVRALMA